MSDLYQFGKNLRDVLRGVLDAGESSDAFPDIAAWRTSCACCRPGPDDVLGYLSIEQRTVWVREGAAAKVKKSFRATEIKGGRWRVSTRIAGREFTDEYDVRVVERIDPEKVGKEPKPGEKRTLKDHDCTGSFKGSDSGCKNLEKVGSTQTIKYDFKFCEEKKDKECAQTFSEVGKTLVWPVKDCKDDPDTISYTYMWTCS